MASMIAKLVRMSSPKRFNTASLSPLENLAG
jgi:hypothetical protein